MATPLARITGTTDVPRGPDVTHRVEVAREWLRTGTRLCIELPRNLTCAGCSGGGCDACRRAGAITLCERGRPPEVIEITLGDAGPELLAGGLTMRIPERGGAPSSPDRPRGLLMLTLMPASSSHPSVRRAADEEPATDPRSSVPRFGAGALLAVAALAVAALLLWFLRAR